MDLIKALGSGKMFRRPGLAFIDANIQALTLTRGDILAGDWEVQKEPLRVEAQDVKDALQAQGFTANQIKTVMDQLRGLNK